MRSGSLSCRCSRRDGMRWTVSCFNPGDSDGDVCDRALQQIVPQLQRAYDLFSRH